MFRKSMLEEVGNCDVTNIGKTTISGIVSQKKFALDKIDNLL